MQTDLPPQILVVDDEAPIRELLCTLLAADGYKAVPAESVEEAFRLLETQEFDAVFSDLSLPGLSGIEILRFLQKHELNTPGIIVTGSGSQETAVQALRLGALDYITKPFQARDISDAARRALELRAKRTRLPVSALLSGGRARKSQKLIGKSEAMRELNALIERVASSVTTVLIRGESGTGKELVARALHDRSPRAGRPLIPVNCGAIPEDLLESELFGHVKGAFTGAIADRSGRFVLADKGTIFLDEIGDMSPKLQVKVLRVLQEQELEPVGSTQTIRVDVRVLAATNVDLERAVEEKRFREDLYYRLNVIPIVAPPLREHPEDLPILIRHFIKTFNRNSARPIEDFAPETMRILQAADWPGNVRELENLVERMSILAKGPVVAPEDLPPKFRHPRPPSAVSQTARVAYPGFAAAPPPPGGAPIAPRDPAFAPGIPPAPPRVEGAEGVSLDERVWIQSAPNFSEPAVVFVGGEGAMPSVETPAGVFAEEGRRSAVPPTVLSEEGIDLYAAVDEFERDMILQALRMSRGVKSRAAELLGIKRTTLVEKMKKKNIVYER